LARSKRHHYVPKALQARFSDQNGQIWYASRENKQQRFESFENRSSTSCFQLRDFYTVLADQDRRSDIVERNFFGKIDNYFASLLREIEAIESSGVVPRFGGEAQEAYYNLLVALFKRTPDVANHAEDEAVGHEVVADVMNEARRSRVVSEEELQHLRVRIHNQNMTTAAKAHADRKTFGHLS